MIDNSALSTANVPWTDPIDEDFHVAIFKDQTLVNRGHLLFVPKYNTPEVVKDAFYDAYMYGLSMLKSGQIDGFNIALNHGSAAGQKVMYPHVRLIPRYEGDTDSRAGEIKNFMLGK